MVVPARRDAVALCEVQSMVRDGLLGAEDGALLDLIAADGLDPRARLAVYRHHVLTTLTAVLEAAFPVVSRLVDRRFFGYAADAFIRRHPPTSPCLAEYGAEFPGFLGDFAPCRHLGYLPDVARLEWALAAAANAADCSALTTGALAALPAAETSRLVLRLHPSVALLDSPWPVDRIWRANQPDADASLTVDVAAGGARLEISRRGDEAVFRQLPPATFALRRALHRGA